jgi:hypothetical protein
MHFHLANWIWDAHSSARINFPYPHHPLSLAFTTGIVGRARGSGPQSSDLNVRLLLLDITQ